MDFHSCTTNTHWLKMVSDLEKRAESVMFQTWLVFFKLFISQLKVKSSGNDSNIVVISAITTCVIRFPRNFNGVLIGDIFSTYI